MDLPKKGGLQDRVLTAFEFKETEARSLETRLVALGAIANAAATKNKELITEISDTFRRYQETLFGLPDSKDEAERRLMKDYDEIMTMSPKMERTKDGGLVLRSLF